MATRRSHLALFVALSTMIGCSESSHEKYLRYEAELGHLYAEGTSVRLVDLHQSSLDQECLDQGQTEIRGLATQRDIDELVAFVRAKWPDEPISKIRVTPRVAMVRTGSDCGLESGFGYEVYFERNEDDRNLHWNFELEHSWIG